VGVVSIVCCLPEPPRLFLQADVLGFLQLEGDMRNARKDITNHDCYEAVITRFERTMFEVEIDEQTIKGLRSKLHVRFFFVCFL